MIKSEPGFTGLTEKLSEPGFIGFLGINGKALSLKGRRRFSCF